MIEETRPKVCANCIHHNRAEDNSLHCMRKHQVAIDIVTGAASINHAPRCEDERYAGNCGLKAKYYEPDKWSD